MKILKPGKVEQRKFVCPWCECEFVADLGDVKGGIIKCPQSGCRYTFSWRDDGEPYEEPVQNDRERLIALLDTNCGYTEEIPAATLADELLEHGVTFREV